jgi:hypothetical protein
MISIIQINKMKLIKKEDQRVDLVILWIKKCI